VLRPRRQAAAGTPRARRGRGGGVVRLAACRDEEDRPELLTRFPAGGLTCKAVLA
jgi:hypothetical protein